jgi:TonB-linked SusC/RagA family outer membrane protein
MLLQALKGAALPGRNAFITKTLLVMRLTAILLLTTCLHLSAKIRAQQINLSEQHVSLDKVFKKITDQTGYLFVYRDEWLKQTRDVSISVHSASLKEVLDICFSDQPFTYAIIDKMVVMKEKPVQAKPAAQEPEQPGLTIRGRVSDSLGLPLYGASVAIKGTKRGTKTDVKGEFELKDVPNGTVLLFSYLGYSTWQATITTNSYVFVVLKRSQDVLDAPVIQAYGTTSRRFNVGSISTVDAETIEKQPVTNVLLALEGQVPGLAINATSGVPGSRVQLQVRGQNTLSSGNPSFKPYDQPLFIIDGTPFAPQNNNTDILGSLASGTSISGGISQLAGLSPFNGINPLDIESISVLKDADATSIYGTQGSNGVILITTKKGKPGKTTFNLSANSGFNSDVRTLKLMNTQQYLQMRKDAFAADGVTPSNDPNDPGYAPDLTVFDQNKYTDWQKVIVGKTSNNTDLHASLSGGNLNTTFLVSGGYTRSDFNFPGNFSDQRLSLHSALHHMSSDNRLTVDLGMDYSYDQNNSVGGGTRDVLNPPNLPQLRDAAGNLQWNYKGIDISQYQFYAYLKQPTLTQTYNLNNTLHLAYKIVSGLSISANLGYSRNTTAGHNENPLAAQTPLNGTATAGFANNAYQTIIAEPQIDYNTNIGKGAFSVLVGGSYKKNLANSNTTTGYGYANDNFLGSINGAATVYSSDQSNIYKYGAGFARVKYIYDQKYILSLTGRRDGSSNFGPGHQFGNFGSAGAGWIFSEEKAFKAALPVISYAKLSGSYGTSGSDGIAAYQYQAFWQPLTYTPAFQGVQPNLPVNLYNSDYSWALKKSLNLSLDLGFFHDRLLLNATFYRDREGNQLAGYPLPAQVGLSSVLENLNALVQNQGWEFSGSSTNVKTADFTWNTNFNISFNRNKLLSFPNLNVSSYANSYVIGKPTSVVMGYRLKGVNPTTGLFEYYTKNGQATTAPNFELSSNGGDMAPIADREVKYSGGFGNTFSYKRFSLFVFFQFSSQTAPNWLYSLYNFIPGLSMANLPVQALNYWKQPGDHVTQQRLVSNYNSDALNAASHFPQSSGAYSDDTYMRLKTVSFSYALPDAALKRLHIKDCRFYVNAQNLLTFTDYKVSDPELFNDFTSFPLQRIVACGLSFNF